MAMVDDINAISRFGIESVSLNTFVNTQIELKKLRFHVPDQEGKSKCHKMHIGGNMNTCPELKVHGTVMQGVEEDMYLGDLISSDGKNKKNVEKRLSKGLGIITQILNLLEMISFGQHYVEIALLLRESMFLNGILFNAEVWYALTKAEITEFENLDRLLLRRILKVPVSSPKESYYLELGLTPIGEIIKTRRIQYLHHLVTRDHNEMLYQFFITQWTNPTKGDFTEEVKENLVEFEIQADFQFLKSKSKDSFKKLVKTQAKKYAFKKLKEEKAKHSKMKNLEYEELKRQEYFTLKGIKVEQIKNIFKLRTRMAPFGENFRGNRESVNCPLCANHLDNQVLGLQCPAIRREEELDIEINDIYKETITLEVAEAATKLLERREKLIEIKKGK